jgi:hypothetical protein
MDARQYLILIAILTTCLPLNSSFADVKRARQQPIEELQIGPRARPCDPQPPGTRRTYFYSEMYCADIGYNCSYILGDGEQIPPECSDLRNHCLCSYSDEYIVPVKEKDIELFEPPAPQ